MFHAKEVILKMPLQRVIKRQPGIVEAKAMIFNMQQLKVLPCLRSMCVLHNNISEERRHKSFQSYQQHPQQIEKFADTNVV